QPGPTVRFWSVAWQATQPRSDTSCRPRATRSWGCAPAEDGAGEEAAAAVWPAAAPLPAMGAFGAHEAGTRRFACGFGGQPSVCMEEVYLRKAISAATSWAFNGRLGIRECWPARCSRRSAAPG